MAGRDEAAEVEHPDVVADVAYQSHIVLHDEDPEADAPDGREEVAEAGYRREMLAEIPDRNGKPMFEVFRFRR